MSDRQNLTETERLIIQKLAEEDAPFILTLLNDQDFLKYIGDKGVRDIDGAVNYLRTGPLASYEQYGYGLYLVRLKSDGSEIGICGIVRRPSLNGPDIGFAFLPQYRRCGYAFEAAKAVRIFAEEKLSIHQLLAITSLNNNDSIRLLEKLGFAFVNFIKPDDRSEELRLFST